MDLIWAGLRKLGVVSASADAAAQCGPEFPEMWRTFVDHVVDTAFTGKCTAAAPSQPPQLPPLRLPSAERLVAVGDLHGDLGKAQRAFRLAGLTNDADQWVGGDTVCVQVGDILDRGPEELKLLYWLERLQQEAQRAGGRLYVLNGNHETMNIQGNYRYATAGADVEMGAWLRWQQLGDKLRGRCGCSQLAAGIPPEVRGVPPEGVHGGRQFNPMRHGALRPGGPVTQRFFASHPIVLQVGSTVFVHGGVLPSHLEYGLDKINQETRQWMLGPASQRPPRFLTGADAIVWAREYSMREHSKCDCDTLQQVLGDMPGAQRMVVGHTIQAGVNGACGQQVLRVDVGMSQGCGNSAVEVLEILGDKQVVRLSEVHGRQVLQEAPQLHTTTDAVAVASGTPGDISGSSSSSISSSSSPGMAVAAAAGSSGGSQHAGHAHQASTSGRPVGVAGVRSSAGVHSSDGPALMHTILRQLVGANAAAEFGVDRGKPAPERTPDEPGGARVSSGA